VGEQRTVPPPTSSVSWPKGAMTHQRVTTSYVSTTMRVREGGMGWGCGGGACRPNAREVKCFLVWAGLRKREVVPIGSPWHMLAQATLGFFLLLWRESRERAWPQSNCSLYTPTHSSGLASTIRNVERVARDTAREGWDGGGAHPRARDTAANRRNDVARECLSREDAS
jgi:hypothetical protein